MNTTVSVIICAAGRGTRAGFEKNKLFLPLPEGGECVLEKTVRAFAREDIAEILVAIAPREQEETEKILAPFPRCRAVTGGETRTQSVKNALALAAGDIVLIHDGARPYVSDKCITDCIESVKKYGSGICALPSTDTTAIAAEGNIVNVPPRADVFTLQTPQGFFTVDIRTAYARIGEEPYTDDSAVYARYIGAPRLFIGNKENKKLTFREDFLPVPPSPARVGFGVDTHAFGKKQDYIVLAGVKIPAESGLVAHSDGDVLVHAVMDALLSASGLRDIGFYFPDTDDKWKDADSMDMLELVIAEIKKQGFAPCNLSVAVQAQKPKLAPFIHTMSETLAKKLQLPTDAVGITAGTNEGLGYVGEGKGITVTATVLLRAL